MRLNTEDITIGCRFWKEINTLAKKSFPPEEYLAPVKLVQMAQKDNFDFLALTEKDTFIGFIALKLYKKLCYLFFLAIEPAFRSKGYGSLALETIQVRYPNKSQVVDFEAPDERAENNEQRQRRRNFYLKNGYRETGLFLSYLGVDYEVFCQDEKFDKNLFMAMMKSIRVKDFSPVYYSK